MKIENEIHQQGENNWVSTGDVTGNVINFGFVPATQPAVHNVFHTFIPKKRRALLEFGAMGSALGGAGGILALGANTSIMVSAVHDHPILKWPMMAVFVFALVLLLGGLVAWLASMLLTGPEFIQKGTWSFRNRSDGLEISIKTAQCPVDRCGGTMHLIALPGLVEPRLVCERNNAHWIQFDHTQEQAT